MLKYKKVWRDTSDEVYLNKFDLHDLSFNKSKNGLTTKNECFAPLIKK